MKKIFFTVLFFAGLQTIIFSQTPKPVSTPPKPDEDEVIIISTNLIQVDAVVLGKDGKQIVNLKPEDFDILENGVKQQITNFSYVTVGSPAKSSENNSKPNSNPVDKLAPPVPIRLKPEQIRRTIALVVDDLGLSFDSIAPVQGALKKFVDEQMQPGDLVAIIRTAGGIGALQQFTSDKNMLYAAIERIRWTAFGRGGVGAFAPVESDSLKVQADDATNSNDIDELWQDIFTVGTLGALKYVVTGMSELSGRKAVVLLSDGFTLTTHDEENNGNTNARVMDAFRNLTESANRASVVINTIDARGLQTLAITAQDSTPETEDGKFDLQKFQSILSSRRTQLFETQQGLAYLSEQTGGRSFINSNNIKGSIEKILEDQKGYYLIGYQPDNATFDPAKVKFNKIEIKVKRPDLKVRYRSGFYGVADKETAKTESQTPQQQLAKALTSPFGTNGVHLRLNTLFGNNAKNGSFIRTLLHVQASDLNFTDEPDGFAKATFEVLALTITDNGVPVDQIDKTYTLRIKKDSDDYQQLIEKGFIYHLTLPVKKPGAYQLRVALRDTQTKKIGSANQFIEVPNLKKDRINLSSIVLQNSTSEQFQRVQAGNNSAAPEGEISPHSDTALRRFPRGSVLQYAYVIYNAKSAGNSPQLTTQMRLFRNGKLIVESKPVPADLTGQTDMQRINVGGAFSLVEKLQPGDYVLQVVVTDALAKESHRIATQWVEFELIN